MHTNCFGKGKKWRSFAKPKKSKVKKKKNKTKGPFAAAANVDEAFF